MFIIAPHFWKLAIWRAAKRIVRISKTLSKELEALEQNEIIARSLYDRILVSVEYSLTPYAHPCEEY